MAKKDLLENPFRDEIYNYLLNHGYVKSYRDDYDIGRALDTSKLLEFVAATQPEQLQKLQNAYGSQYEERFIDLVCQKINSRGLLASLNEWVEDYTSNTKIRLAYFKSNLQAMTGNQELYEKNIFSVCREFVYEDKAEPYRVDLAIFLNGIPIIMIELKKQTAGQKASFDGTKQFKNTRNPDELVFSFNKRTLVYFALDEMVAFAATRLDRKETRFLPFNLGAEDEGAGNPITPGKHCTWYIWEEILQRDMLLRIIREFMFIDDEGDMIFPRYHQLRAVLRCEQDVKERGIGGRYLIWHSAGSGKTKTIAWLAARMINHADINTVIVISDRTVIDGQLGNELRNVDGNKGVAQHIEDGSQGLKRRLEEGGYIIVTTLQKFRPILSEIKKFPERNYAIIIDEAHSSTAGKSMSKAAEMLTGMSLKEAVERDELYDEQEDGQNQLLKNGNAIRNTSNVSYFAFTATPKKETMELFGTRKEIGKSYFDKYSMRQAIEEGFILNPLLCYTSYHNRYQIEKKKDDETEYESARAQAAILNYVTTTDAVIQEKTQIMLDDFIDRRQTWLGGKSKAMIITPSRKHAVCYKLAVDEYLKKRGCGFRACVAFTGTIDIDGVKYTEESMNKDLMDSGTYDIKALIHNHDDIRIVIVADKLQTGFDENKLCAMYIDKKLRSAVKAVQTISRLNRTAKNKRTFVLDFINDVSAIQEYFTQYYGGEIYLPTEHETNPNILFAKRDSILDYCVITLRDVERLYALIEKEDDPDTSGELTAMLASIDRAYRGLEEKEQKLFLAELSKFNKLFYYISAVYNNWNEDMERMAIVFSVVRNVLYQVEPTEQINPAELVELVDFSIKLAQDELTIVLTREDQPFAGVSTNVMTADKTFSVIDEIIERFNAAYAGAGEELKQMVETLSQDSDLRSNVQNSAASAYEAVISERISDEITSKMLEGVMDGDAEKAAFYTEFGDNVTAQKQIRNQVIRKIMDFLNLAG